MRSIEDKSGLLFCYKRKYFFFPKFIINDVVVTTALKIYSTVETRLFEQLGTEGKIKITDDVSSKIKTITFLKLCILGIIHCFSIFIKQITSQNAVHNTFKSAQFHRHENT